MNPVFIHWWHTLGPTSQVAIVVSIIGGLFGLFKVLFEKHLRAAILLFGIVIVSLAAFLFWPAAPTAHDSGLEKLLYGEWKATFKMFGKYPWDCTTVYNRDGKFMHTGLVSLPNGESQPLTVNGSWFAKDGHVYETVESAVLGLNAMPMPTETNLVMEVIRLDDKIFSYEDLTFRDGKHTMVKIKH